MIIYSSNYTVLFTHLFSYLQKRSCTLIYFFFCYRLNVYMYACILYYEYYFPVFSFLFFLKINNKNKNNININIIHT